jgi:hypothetical protein
MLYVKGKDKKIFFFDSHPLCTISDCTLALTLFAPIKDQNLGLENISPDKGKRSDNLLSLVFKREKVQTW